MGASSTRWRRGRRADMPRATAQQSPGGGEAAGGEPADVCPRLGRPRPCGAIPACGDVVTAKVEEVVDPVAGGEETLCPSRRLEALHLPFSSPEQHRG